MYVITVVYTHMQLGEVSVSMAEFSTLREAMTHAYNLEQGGHDILEIHIVFQNR